MRTCIRPLQTLCALSLLGATPCLALTPAEDAGWPREIVGEEVRILVYQPQPERFEGVELAGRAAVSVQRTSDAEPVFGAIWMTARVATDRELGLVSIEDVTIDRVRFQDATEEGTRQLAAILEREIPRWDMELSLDRLVTSLSASELARGEADRLETAPPTIQFVDHPAVLVTIDGSPELQTIEGTDLMRVVNTPFTIALDTRARRYYLDGGASWYVAGSVTGPWKPTEVVPDTVQALRVVDPDADDAPPEGEGEDGGAAPQVIVATRPTELISSDGAPKWTPLADSELLYISNSESDVLLELATQRVFVLLAGRWYVAGSTAGPWSFVRSDELPESFSAIPDDSEVAHLRTFVAGTDEAEDAVYDAQVPQTAAIKRSATLDVTYDGEPRFRAIAGTQLQYASNTASAVIVCARKYYCCSDAVWFIADKALGPWVVCDEIPDEIYTLPPDCPVYNVRYVHVYDSTPEVVYVGYLPGYAGSYVYYGTIVYGTGYYYAPWYGRYYYARPATWGFHVRYSPWGGWSFGLSYSTGPFRFTVVRGGWWGPCGPRGYHAGYRHGYRAGARAGYRAGQRNANIYKNQRNAPRTTHHNDRARTASGAAQGRTRQQARPATDRKNNVYTDREGNVHRRTENGWESREGNSWSQSKAGTDSAGPSQRTAGRTPGATTGATAGGGRATGATTGSRTNTGGRTASGSSSSRTTSSSSRSSLDRQHSARQRGTSRTQTRSSSYGGTRRGGGMRGRR